MKLHLPVKLLSAILASCAALSVSIHAAPLTITTNQTFDTDVTWNEATTIGANDLTLTIEAGKTVTQAEGAFNIGNNSLTITGGGTLKIETAATEKVGSGTVSKTLTINNATLDLSSPNASLSAKGDNYTRYQVTVTNGGVLRVGEYTYDGAGLGSIAVNTSYWTLNNGRLEITKDSDGTFGNGLTVAAGGGTVEVVNGASTMSMTADNTHYIQLNGILTITGAGSMTTTSDNVFRGNGSLIKDGTGTLTLANSSTFTGGVVLNGGTLIVSNAAGLGTKKSLSVTGNASIGGISAAYQGLSLSSGVSLDVSAVDNNAGLTMNSGTLSLSGGNTMTGNLNLGAGTFIDATHMTANGAALLTLNGTLTVNGSLLLENSDDVNWTAGTYNLINATGGITGDLLNTIVLGTDYIGNWSTADNVLKFVVQQVTSLTWTGGGDNTWTTAGSGANSPWNAGNTFTDGNGVIFGDVTGNVPQTVTLAGPVNPGLVLVNAEHTNYTWAGTGSLTGSGKLQKTGSGSLTIATDNSGFSGEVLLGGGTVEMGHAHALGTGNIIFNGSTLKYGTGITTDISGQIKTDPLASNAILVDTNGNAVSWASLTGWTGTITRKGDGSLTLGAGTYGGKLTNSGTGDLIIGAGNSTLTGGISGTVTKTGTGTLTMNQSAFNASGGATLVINGGTLNLQDGTYSSNMNITLGTGAIMDVATAGAKVTGTGTLTMGADSILHLRNGNTAGANFDMKIVLDAGDGFASIDGAISGNNTAISSSISGVGGLKIISGAGANGWSFSTGWVNNSYTGDTEIAGTANEIKLTYNVGSSSVAAGQTLTPWGQGDVTMGGNGKNVTVTFSNLNGAAASTGISIAGDITLKGANAATKLDVFTGTAGTMTLNGKVTVETSGTGTATLGGGSSLKLGGGLAGAGTLAVTTRNNTGALTLGGDVSGFTGTLNLTGSNLYLDASSTLNGTFNASTAKVTALSRQTVTGTLSAASLAADTAALSADGAALTVNNLALGTDAGVSLNVSGNIADGTYTLASWNNLTAGNFADATGNLTLTGALSGLYKGTFNVDTAGKTVNVTVSLADGVVRWDGNPIGAVDNTTTYLFDGTHTGNVVLTGNMNAKGIYFNNGVGEDLSFSNNGGTMTGTGPIVKKGEGKVTFTSINAGYQGTVSIQEGTLAVTMNQALGTAAITVERDGTLEIGLAGDIATILGDQTPTINGGTLAFTSGGENTLNKVLAGSAVNLNVLGAGTTLTITSAQTNTSLTTVGQGAALNLGKNGTGVQSLLYGNLLVNGGTLNTTAGDPFGYSNTTNFGTLTINDGTWNISGGNTTMANTRMVFNNSRVILNLTGTENGFDLFSGTNSIVTQQSATGMSSFSVVAGGPTGGTINAMTLRGGTAIFDIARGNFTLDDVNTSDLKLDLVVATEQNGTNLTKQGNGVLQLTKANTYTGQTLIREGTVLLTDAGTLGTGAVTLGGGGDAYLTYAVAGDNTTANVISGKGTVTQQGTGNVTLSGANTYTGTTNVESGTLTAGSATAFGASTVSISSGATLAIGDKALANAVSVKSGAAGALSTGTITSNGGTIGNLTLGSYSRLDVTGSLGLASAATLTFDMGGLTAGGAPLVSISGGLTLTGTHNLTLDNYTQLTDAGSYSLLTVGSGTLTLGSFTIGELINEAHPELTYALGLSADGKTLVLKIESAADMLTWAGAEGTGVWTAGDVDNWAYAGSGTKPTSTNDQALLFDNTAANKTVTITGDVTPASIVVTNSGEDNTYTFQGDGSITGAATALTKRGDGLLQIRNTNTYGGSTTLEGGIVDINADGALGTGSIIFGGGTLQASGNVTLTQTLLQKSVADSVKLSTVGADTTLTIDTQGQTGYLGLAWNIAGNGTSALANMADTQILTGTVTIANGSTFSLSGGNELALSGILKNISGTLSKTDGGTLLIKAVNGNDALNGTLANATGSLMLSGYGAATANRTITVNGTLNAPAVDATYGVTLDLKRSQNIDTLLIGGGTGNGNTQASAVNVNAGTTLTSATVKLGGANGQGALAGNLNINGGAAQLGGISVEDGSNSAITLAGNGTLTLGGDITGTSGSLTLGEGTLASSADWTSSLGVVLNAASGKTTTVATTGSITLNGALSGTGSITKTGTGTLTLGNASADYAGTVTLREGTLALTADGYKGALNITGGALTGGTNHKGAKNVTVNAAAGVTSITLGGLAGASLKTINTTEAGTVISGIHGAASLDSAGLVVGVGNISKTQDLAGSASIIQFDAAGTQLNVETLTLTLSADLINAMQGWGTGERTAWLNLTNGALGYGTATFNPLLETLGFAVTGINGGAIGITGDATQIYAVGSEDKTITSNAELDPYRAVIVDGNLALNLPGVDDTAEGLTINNLSGAPTGVINVTSTNDKTASIILNNEKLGIDPDTSGPDTRYAGTINGGAANIVKTGQGGLELSGTVNTTGTLDLQDGTLQLSGNADLGAIKLNSDNAGNLATLDITGTATADTLTDEGNGAALTLGQGGKLTLTAAGSALDTSAIGGKGQLNLADGASLALNGTSKLDGVQLHLEENSTATLANAANTISGLTGSGALQNGSSLEIAAAGSSLYQGTLSGEGSITVNGTGTQTLQGNGAAGQALNAARGTLELLGAEGGNGSVTYKSLTAGNGAHVRLGTVGTGKDAVNTTLTVTNGLDLAGSTLELVVNTNRSDLFSNPVITVQSGNVNLNGTTVSLGSLEDYDDPADPTANLNFTLVDAQGAGGTVTADGATIAPSGYFDFYYQEFGIRAEGGKIVVTGMVKTDNAFLGTANTANSEAGANLLWNSRGNAPKGTQLGDLREAIRNDIQTGNGSRAARSMAAAAGSTVNALGTAQKDALRDQMGWIRNRTTLMGVNPAYINEDLPYFHMWMEGTGSYAKLDTKGDESGYQLTTWGGTVGMDVDLSDHFTMGAAFTANYGDLTASAADTADGHLDSYYANLFGRYQSKRWAHTLILTGGWNDARLNRTVNYGEGSYGTQGNTNGWGFGAMYELTYDIYLNEDKSSVFQPLANASVVTTSMDGYTETGAGNAGLSVGKQEWTTGTVALGGRWLGLAGSNLFGREAMVEVRANVAQDMGDHRGKTAVGFLANPGYTQTVRGAKVGTTALQIGAGISVPVGTQGTIFVNGNGDIRDGASSLNGSVGYRYDF